MRVLLPRVIVAAALSVASRGQEPLRLSGTIELPRVAAGGRDTNLAAVGTVNRPPDGPREGASSKNADRGGQRQKWRQMIKVSNSALRAQREVLQTFLPIEPDTLKVHNNFVCAVRSVGEHAAARVAVEGVAPQRLHRECACR
jgi:hypothetical protein